jgi:hypothetical protein
VHRLRILRAFGANVRQTVGVADFRPLQPREPTGLEAWGANLSTRKRAALSGLMALASVGLAVPFGVYVWRDGSTATRLTLALAWLLIAGIATLGGVRARRRALTMPLSPAVVQAQIGERLTWQRLLLPGALGAALAAAGLADSWRGALISTAALYAGIALGALAIGFWQRANADRPT